MSLFVPLKPYVRRSSERPLSALEDDLQRTGVQAALDLMKVSWDLFENVASTGAKFHYSVFCIFDTTTVLCSAFVHDQARSLPQRDAVLEAIGKGLDMLLRLHSASKTAADLCQILNGLLLNLPLSAEKTTLVGVPKRPNVAVSKPKNVRPPRVPRKKKKPNSPLSQEITQADDGSGHASGRDGAQVDTPETNNLQSTSDSGIVRNTSRQAQDSPLGQLISGVETRQAGNANTTVMGLLTYSSLGNQGPYQGTISDSFIPEGSPVSPDNVQKLCLRYGGLQAMSGG